LGLKTALIFVVLLVFVYGIFGLPHGLSGSAVVDSMLNTSHNSLFREGIHLGLDLKGGTHLILQVQVSDPIRADAQQVAERLKSDLKTNADISQPDPQNRPDWIVIKGLDPSQAGDLRDEVNTKLGTYDLASAPGGGWQLTMKPSAQTEIKNNAVQQAIET